MVFLLSFIINSSSACTAITLFPFATTASTSLSDAGIASSIAEAMACQKIVIVSDSGENKLWISHGVNGFLFKTGCSKSLFDAIIKAIDRKDLWNEIGIKARETILERNDISNEMKKMYMLMDLV